MTFFPVKLSHCFPNSYPIKSFLPPCHGPTAKRTKENAIDAEPLSRAGSISSDEEFLARARRA
jgi:hypothetical protein